jgi:hypothetical protein
VTTGKLRKFFALPNSDKLSLLLAALWLPVMHIRLKYLGLPSCLRSLSADKPDTLRAAPVFDEGRYQQALDCGYSVALAARYGLISGTCLSRSLTIMRLMACRGVEGNLRLGVKLHNGELRAHAWVEVAGVALPGVDEREYEPFPGFVAGENLRNAA